MTKNARLWLIFLKLFLLISGLVSASREDDFDRLMGEPQDKTEWVDPLDMGIYEPSEPVIDKKLVENLENDLSICNAKLKVCQAEKTSEKKDKPVTKPKSKVTESSVAVANDLFMKRHVKVLLQKMMISTDDDVHLSLEIKLTARDISVLRAFTDDGSAKVQDVDPILSSFIIGVEEFHLKPWSWSWQEDFGHILPQLREPLLLALAVGTLVYVLFFLMRHLSWWKLTIILLVFSISWHWLRMYKMRWAAKHATLLSSGTVPPECHPQEMSWLQSIQYTARSVMTGTDRCGEYHEAIMVDPLYEVNPLTAAVDLAANLLLHPMSKLGSEVGAMFAGLLAAVPIFWKVPVLLVFVLLLMLVMVMAAGYRIKLPMFLGAIEPARGNQQNVAVELEAIKLALQEIKAAQKTPALEMKKENVAALESQPSLAIETLSHHNSTPNITLPIQNIPSTDIPDVESENKTPPRQVLHDNVENTPSRRKLYDDPSFSSSQPVNLRKAVVGLQMDKNSGVLDLSTPTKKSRVPQENLSDGLCVSPTKTLVTRNVSSPSCTEFSWVTTGDKETIEDPLNKSDATEDLSNKIGNKEFLSSVEGIFERPKHL